MIYSVINEMGKGKTLFSTIYAMDYADLKPNQKIYANYTLNLSSAVFTPYMFLPFNQLKNCAIICDDFYALKSAKNLVSVIVNMSRKMDIDIILTCQYYTMIEPIIRSLSIITQVDYKKESDTLYITFLSSDMKVCKGKFKVRNAVEKAKNIYNTNEIVKPQTPTNIQKEILKWSNDLEELEQNINLYYNSKVEQQKLLKLLSKNSKFQ